MQLQLGKTANPCAFCYLWVVFGFRLRDSNFCVCSVLVVLCCFLFSHLKNQWLSSSCDNVDEYSHLSGTIHRLKAFNAKRKWRAVAAVVMLGTRLGMGLKKRARNASDDSSAGEHGCEFPVQTYVDSLRQQREVFGESMLSFFFFCCTQVRESIFVYSIFLFCRRRGCRTTILANTK